MDAIAQLKYENNMGPVAWKSRRAKGTFVIFDPTAQLKYENNGLCSMKVEERRAMGTLVILDPIAQFE